MLEASWMLVNTVTENKKTKKKISKEEFKREFLSHKIYENELNKIQHWLDTVMMDSTRFNWKKLHVYHITYRSPYKEWMNQDGPLSHTDSTQLKKLPESRILQFYLENEIQAWQCNIFQVKWNGQWKFIAKPQLRYAMRDDLLDTMFHAAVKAHFIDKSIINPYVLVQIEDSVEHHQAELIIPLEEWHAYVLHLRKNKEITREEIFTVMKRHALVDPELYEHLNANFNSAAKNKFTYSHSVARYSSELLLSRHPLYCDDAFAMDYFRKGILVSCSANALLLVLDLNLAE